MFISITIKTKVSSTLMNTVTIAILILVSYLAKHVVMLYQQYHMEDRLEEYLGELEEVITCTDMLQIGVVGLGELFSIVQRAVRGKPEHDSDKELRI